MVVYHHLFHQGLVKKEGASNVTTVCRKAQKRAAYKDNKSRTMMVMMLMTIRMMMTMMMRIWP